eukprot:206390_1
MFNTKINLEKDNRYSSHLHQQHSTDKNNNKSKSLEKNEQKNDLHATNKVQKQNSHSNNYTLTLKDCDCGSLMNIISKCVDKINIKSNENFIKFKHRFICYLLSHNINGITFLEMFKSSDIFVSTIIDLLQLPHKMTQDFSMLYEYIQQYNVTKLLQNIAKQFCHITNCQHLVILSCVINNYEQGNDINNIDINFILDSFFHLMD